MSNEINNAQDVLDSRDIFKRIEELEDIRDSLLEDDKNKRNGKNPMIVLNSRNCRISLMAFGVMVAMRNGAGIGIL